MNICKAEFFKNLQNHPRLKNESCNLLSIAIAAILFIAAQYVCEQFIPQGSIANKIVSNLGNLIFSITFAALIRKYIKIR